MITQEMIATHLKEYAAHAPDLQAAFQVADVQISAQKISVKIVLGYPAAGIQEKLTQALGTFLQEKFPAYQVEVQLQWRIVSHAVQQANLQPVAQVKNIIAVGSAKGGVGKSTTAVNLALALQAEGARVGIIDADIYGPNQPLLLKTQGEKAVKTEQGLQPIVRYGLQTMSMGYLSDAETPIMWRGPMISQAVQQLTYETQWQDVDYLIMDLPPGTGDIQLTLAQKIPVAGTVMVTTPQTVATQDTRKGLEMMRKLNITLLGLIENMSYFRCSHCGEKEFIFGKRGALQLAQQTGCELVGSLPFERLIQVQTEQGEPIVSAVPESEAAQLYRQIARKIAAKLSLQAKNYADKFKVVVENKK